ncbi:MAG TPA: hypothetical protein VFG50_13420 [Rhodothermales bacterium]|nr:hypothetical protein [Rhodothermales bacterium]
MARSRAKSRSEQAMQFAELVGAYQDDHWRLMYMLHQDGVSQEEFDTLNDRLHGHARALKAMKLELARQAGAGE